MINEYNKDILEGSNQQKGPKSIDNYEQQNINLLDFFRTSLFLSSSDELKSTFKDASTTCTYHSNNAVLLGSKKTGKTSLLFQYAYSLAKSGEKVLYLCSKSRIYSSPPILSHRLRPTSQPQSQSQSKTSVSPSLTPELNENQKEKEKQTSNEYLDINVLKKISIKYISDSITLVRYLSSLHMLGWYPNAIIVDDLSTIFSGVGDRTPMIKVIALLKNITQHFTDKIQKENNLKLKQNNSNNNSNNNNNNNLNSVISWCRFIISDSTSSSADIPDLVQFYERWIPMVLTVTPEEGNIRFQMDRIFGRRDPHQLQIRFGMDTDQITIRSVSFVE